MFEFILGCISSLYGLGIVILAVLLPDSFEGGKSGSDYKLIQTLIVIAGGLLLVLGYLIRE